MHRQSISALLLLSISLSTFIASGAATIEKTELEKHWEKTLKDGVDALDSNKYWIAEPLLKEAVIEAGKFGGEDLRLAKSFGELGRLYAVRGRFPEAESYLEEELFIKQQVLDKEGEELIPAMGAMTKFYLNYGSKEKADKLADEMLEFVEGKLKEATNLKSKVTKVGKSYVLEAGTGMASPVVRDPFLEWAIACDGVASVYMLQKDFLKAEHLFKASLEVKEMIYGKNHLSLANSYDSLGTLALEQKNYFTAESHLKDAYEMSSRILGTGNPQVYGRLDKYAKCLIQEGKRAEAQQLYLTAQGFWKDGPPKSGEPIRVCYALGNLFCEDKNYAEAEPLLKRAMQQAQEYYGESSDAVVPYIQRYAYVLYYLGRKPESDEFKALAASISGNVVVAEAKEESKKPPVNELSTTRSSSTQ